MLFLPPANIGNEWFEEASESARIQNSNKDRNHCHARVESAEDIIMALLPSSK